MKGCNYLSVMLLGIIIGAGVFSSCSIKEDRKDCPCWMTVNISEQNGHNFNTGILRIRGNSSDDAIDYEYNESYTIEFKDFIQSSEYAVPRGSVGVSAVAIDGKTHNMDIKDEHIEIPLGCQTDSLYGFFKTFHTRRETVVCDVIMHKQFCTINLVIDTDGMILPQTLEIHGNVSGLNAHDLLPIEGEFRCYSTLAEGKCTFRIPRQIDDSMIVALKRGETIVQSFPLGQYIANSGYNWSAESLADIDITIDVPSQEVKLIVSEWDKIVIMDVVI